VEKYKYPSFAIETASEYKYQITMETAEQNTSKQVSAKENCTPECVQVLKKFFFFFEVE